MMLRNKAEMDDLSKFLAAFNIVKETVIHI